MITLLIDGDEWAYKAAHGGQRKHYIAVNGKTEIFRGDKKAEVVRRIGNNDFDIVEQLEDLGEESALLKMKDWIDRVRSNIEASLGPSQLNVYLSGENNFRYDLAKVVPYKGNRDDHVKPIHLAFIRQVLRDEYGATAVDYLEADDLMSANQRDDTIIVTQDKDLNMVPGYRYLTNHQKVVHFTDPYCTRFFHQQMLTGDSTDNIPGLSYVGEVAAQKILKNYKDSEGLYECVHKEYIDRMESGKHFVSKGKKKGEILWETSSPPWYVVWEIANLLYMRRSLEEDAYWYPPNADKEKYKEQKENLSSEIKEAQVLPVEGE